jgi:hypothetical protein
VKKRTLIVLALAAATVALQVQAKAQDQSQKTSVANAQTGQTQDKQATKAGQDLIPANAERIDATHFRAKDDKGVVWEYTKTPFGVARSRADEKPANTPNVSGWKATDLGDSVRFERQTPFGTSAWTKKKSDLNAAEKLALANATPSGALPETAKQ